MRGDADAAHCTESVRRVCRVDGVMLGQVATEWRQGWDVVDGTGKGTGRGGGRWGVIESEKGVGGLPGRGSMGGVRGLCYNLDGDA